MIYGGEKTSDEMCMTFLMVYPKVDLGNCFTMYGLTDLYFFYYQAASRGFYLNFTDGGDEWDMRGFYDVTVPGAEKFYHDFVIGNITGNFDGIPEMPLTDPQRRKQYCYDMNLNPLNGSNEEVEIKRPSINYDEYDMDEFYVCSSAPASSSGFEWNGWYIFVGAAVIVLVVLAVAGWCILKSRQKKTVDLQSDYLAAQNEYGSGGQTTTRK